MQGLLFFDGSTKDAAVIILKILDISPQPNFCSVAVSLSVFSLQLKTCLHHPEIKNIFK
jgi:hypothetical protein